MRRLLYILSALALVTVVACGSAEDNASAPVDEEAGATHNEADISFVQGMIPHHEQAVEMSDLARSNSENTAVTDLAEQIKAAQAPEIDQMEGFLQTWGVKTADGEHGGGHGGGGGHPGMLSEDQLAELGAAEGAAFDRLFLTGMIEHHRGAVTASEKELAEGVSDDAQSLAQEIIDAQKAEIAEMEQLLTQV